MVYIGLGEQAVSYSFPVGTFFRRIHHHLMESSNFVLKPLLI